VSGDDEQVRAYRARWVIPVEGPPLAGGVVTVRGDTIASVGENTSAKPPIDLGNVALLPGLVNAHTHLEFSTFREPIGDVGTSFPAWLEKIIARRRELFSQPVDRGAMNREAVELGLAESQAAGVAAIGEIAVSDWQAAAFETAARPDSATVFYELLGLSSDRVEPLLEEARQHLAGAIGQTSDAPLRRGLSPHAPYTVNPRLLREAVALSAETKTPLAMHLAESWEELELLQSHSGALVDVLRSVDRWYPGELPRGLRPMDYLETLAGAHRTLVIHGNFLVQEEMEFLASQPQMTVVYCPRTQARFNHGPYPLAEMLRAGARVALGTDSRSSNPDLSLWEEMRHVVVHHSTVSPEEVLKLATLKGAQALGIDDRFGSLAPGKRAALVQVPLKDAASEPYESLFSAEGPPHSVPGSSLGRK
jgi:cytosine/adenosine deaminase-related metal-dependent hydrolase